MIKLDISKALPSTIFSYLASLMPGLFFIVSVFIGNTELSKQLRDPIKDFGPYIQIFLALFTAFMVGTAFISGMRLMQRAIYYLYVLSSALRRVFIKRCFIPLLVPVLFDEQQKRWRVTWAANLDYRVSRKFYSDLRRIYRCLHVTIVELLKLRYGIDVEHVDQETAEVWYWSVGRLSPEDYRGEVMGLAFHGSGWAGIIAWSLAPGLHNWYYIGLCICLIIFGFRYHWSIQSNFGDPMKFAMLRLRAALRELETARKEQNVKAPTERDRALTVSVR